jgi:hypothetical protein
MRVIAHFWSKHMKENPWLFTRAAFGPPIVDLDRLAGAGNKAKRF